MNLEMELRDLLQRKFDEIEVSPIMPSATGRRIKMHRFGFAAAIGGAALIVAVGGAFTIPNLLEDEQPVIQPAEQTDGTDVTADDLEAIVPGPGEAPSGTEYKETYRGTTTVSVIRGHGLAGDLGTELERETEVPIAGLVDGYTVYFAPPGNRLLGLAGGGPTLTSVAVLFEDDESAARTFDFISTDLGRNLGKEPKGAVGTLRHIPAAGLGDEAFAVRGALVSVFSDAVWTEYVWRSGKVVLWVSAYEMPRSEVLKVVETMDART